MTGSAVVETAPSALAARWARTWPVLLAAAVVLTVAAPAAVASYGHAREVAARHDPAMADYLPLSVDGMLLAALVVMWVRRRRGVPVGAGPWAAFVFGIVVTIGANAAAVDVPSFEAYAVHLFPPVALAVALELVALVAGRAPRVTADPMLEPRVVERVVVPAAVPAVPEPVPAVTPVAVPVVPAVTPVTEHDEDDDVTGEDAPVTEPVTAVEPEQGTDAEIVAWLRANGVPSRRKLNARYRCGPSRYDRLAADARTLEVAS